MRSNNMHRTFGISRSRARGFAVIEALIAFLVVAFGMMALGSFQFTLSRASDVARQRSEATRIAQREIDRLRSFGQKTADLNTGDDRFTFAEEVAVGTSTATESSPLTNTDYAIARTVSAPTAPVPALGERFRWIDIAVTWFDRTGGAQRIALSSAISDGAPGELGASTTGRSGVPGTLRPKNRNINIPYPAVNLAGGLTSAFVPPPGTAIFTFNNETGNVTQACRATAYAIADISSSGTTATALAAGHPFTTGMRVRIAGASPGGYNGEVTVTSAIVGASFTYDVTNGLATPATLTTATATRVVTLTEGVDLATVAGVQCTDFTTQAYVLSGYIRFKTGSGGNSDATRLTIADPLGLTDPTRALVATDPSQAPSATTSPILITGATGEYVPDAYECYAQRQLTVRRNSNATAGQTDILNIPDLGSATVVPADFTANNAPRYIAYMCIVTPRDHDNDPSTDAIWTGQVTFNPLGWTFASSGTLGAPADDAIGAATGSGRLCRFTSDYNDDDQVSNGEHPLHYRQVTGTLDNQNYLVVDGEDRCPGDDAITPTVNNPTADDYTDTNTVEHQPTGELSSRCETITGNNTVLCTTINLDWREAAATAPPLAQIPME